MKDLGVRGLAALAVVYVVWGSTYVAIDMAIAAVPPMLLMAARFALAGGVLFAWTRLRARGTVTPPTVRQWAEATLTGTLLLVGGTGLVALAMTWLATGTTALVAATVPVWMALFGRALFGDRLSTRATLGLSLGLLGIAVLVDPAGGQVTGLLVALAGAVAWAAGSMRSRIVSAPSRPLVAASMEMLGSVPGFLLLAGLRGEFGMVDVAAITSGTVLAFVYLVTAGSIVAFTAYRWLLAHASPTIVGTHAYVNPMVAVLLGWAVLGEQLTARMLVAGAIVVLSTGLVVTGRPNVPVPAQLTSGADVFVGVRRLRRVRAVGRRMSRVPAAALRAGAVPVARGYRAVRSVRRPVAVRHPGRRGIARRPEDLT